MKVSKNHHMTKDGVIKKNPRYVWVGDKFTFATTPDFSPSSYGYYPPETWVPVVVKSKWQQGKYQAGFATVLDGKVQEANVVFEEHYPTVNEAKNAAMLLIPKLKQSRRNALDVRKTDYE